MTTHFVMRPIKEDFDVFRGCVVELTDQCNMNCSYCSRDCTSARNNFLPLDTILRILNFFSSKRDRSQSKYFQMTGGEPLLHPQFPQILKYAIDQGFTCRVQTNGILLDKMARKHRSLFSSPQVITKVSLDGHTKEIHGIFRGERTFNPAIKGVKTLLKINQNVALKSVLHTGNLPALKEMFKFCIDLGVAGWSYNLLMEKGRSSAQAEFDQLSVAKLLIPLYKQKRFAHLFNGSYLQILYWLHWIGNNRFPAYFYITSKGDVYITDNTTPDRMVGSVFHDDLEESFAASTILEKINLTISQTLINYIGTHLDVVVEEGS